MSNLYSPPAVPTPPNSKGLAGARHHLRNILFQFVHI